MKDLQKKIPRDVETIIHQGANDVDNDDDDDNVVDNDDNDDDFDVIKASFLVTLSCCCGLKLASEAVVLASRVENFLRPQAPPIKM